MIAVARAGCLTRMDGAIEIDRKEPLRKRGAIGRLRDVRNREFQQAVTSLRRKIRRTFSHAFTIAVADNLRLRRLSDMFMAIVTAFVAAGTDGG